MDMYMKYLGATPEQFMESMRPEAETRIKNSLVLEAIAEAEKIKVSDKEFDAEIEELSKMYQMEADKLKEIMGDAEKEQIKLDISVRKAVELVASKAVEKAPEKEESKAE